MNQRWPRPKTAPTFQLGRIAESFRHWPDVLRSSHPTGYDSNTAFHLAAYRAEGAKLMQRGAALYRDGHREWATYIEIDYNRDSFEALGHDFERDLPVTIGQVGSATARLFPARIAVDYATQWLNQRRTQGQ